MHKRGITELHHFLKAYPLKRQKVEELLESTGPAFRKYISRALAIVLPRMKSATSLWLNTLSSLFFSLAIGFKYYLILVKELESKPLGPLPRRRLPRIFSSITSISSQWI